MVPSRRLTRRESTILAVVAILIGLVVHESGAGDPSVVRDMLGDALWAAMMFWLIGALRFRISLDAQGSIAYGVCVVVELSQLIRAPALDALRETHVGGLILGSSFDARDLLAYAVGVAVAAGITWRMTLSPSGRIR